MNVRIVRRNGEEATGDIMSDFLTLREAMGRLVEDSFVPMRRWGDGPVGHSFPVDAWEDDDQLVIEAMIPGLKAEDVELTVEQDSLRISGGYPERPSDRPWIVTERPQGRFERTFHLRIPIEMDKIEAKMHEGILRVTLPKSESVKPRRIQIAAN